MLVLLQPCNGRLAQERPDLGPRPSASPEKRDQRRRPGPVNQEEDGPVEVCLPKTDGDKRLPAGEVAFTEISGSQCQFPEILGAYEAVYRWVKEHDREPDGPAREIYLNQSGEDLQMEIAVPMR
ncbi:MAG: GyrI-like domain-containing protein [Gaiellaceae bacterium]